MIECDMTPLRSLHGIVEETLSGFFSSPALLITASAMDCEEL